MSGMANIRVFGQQWNVISVHCPKTFESRFGDCRSVTFVG